MLCRIERRPPKLDLTIYPYLPRVDGRDHLGEGSYMALLGGSGGMSDTPQVLLAHHLKALKLPTFLREHDKLARQCAAEGVDHPAYLLRLAELELLDRERRMVERRIRAGPLPGGEEPRQLRLHRAPVLEQDAGAGARPRRVRRARENVIALGQLAAPARPTSPSGSGWPPARRASRSASPPRPPWSTSCWRPGRARLLRLQRQLAAYKLLIVDELGYVPLSPTGAELLFEVFSRRYERGSILVTSNLPFDEWTSVFGAERLTGALLDRLTHHVHILEMNGDSYRLAHSKRRSRRPRADATPEATPPD